MKTGVLILNLGTPNSASTSDVRKYLAEFLMDPYVVDIPWFARFLLVHAIILRTRPKKSAHAYQSVWTDQGSPLMVHSKDLESKLIGQLGSEYDVKLAMRYGEPNVQAALEDFKKQGIQKILFLPLYPQYSWAATESSRQWFLKKIATVFGKSNVPELKWVQDFYDEDGFIEAFASKVKQSLASFEADQILFSFHGVPERHVKKTDQTGSTCLQSKNCCDQISAANRNCYRAQCFATARSLAKKLGLRSDQYQVSFQSRLGRTPWIKPYTDVVYEELNQKGVKNVLVVCPAFVADCLETLEEIEIRGRESYPGDLRLVPSLNSDDLWVKTLANWIRDHSSKNSRFQELNSLS